MEFVDINYIMGKVTRHPLMKEISFETVIDYTVDFIQLVGTPPSFFDKTAIIDIHEYRGELPCDFYQMTQVRLAPKPCHPSELAPTFRYSTDSFHMSPAKPMVSDLTYKIQGRCIFTSPLKEGPIEIAYKAMPVNDEGQPLIPDNASYTRALQAYIKKEYFTEQFDQGKIDQRVMMKADQDYAWAVGQAQIDLIRPTVDQMESIANLWNTLIPRGQEHRKGFLHTGSKEHFRTH